MLQPEQQQLPANMIVSNNKKEKPILHDPQIIPRVQQVRIVFVCLVFLLTPYCVCLITYRQFFIVVPGRKCRQNLCGCRNNGP